MFFQVHSIEQKSMGDALPLFSPAIIAHKLWKKVSNEHFLVGVAKESRFGWSHIKY